MPIFFSFSLFSLGDNGPIIFVCLFSFFFEMIWHIPHPLLPTFLYGQLLSHEKASFQTQYLLQDNSWHVPVSWVSSWHLLAWFWLSFPIGYSKSRVFLLLTICTLRVDTQQNWQVKIKQTLFYHQCGIEVTGKQQWHTMIFLKQNTKVLLLVLLVLTCDYQPVWGIFFLLFFTAVIYGKWETFEYKREGAGC